MRNGLPRFRRPLLHTGLRAVLLAALWLAAFAAPTYAATYSYAGSTFTTADAPWTTSNRVTGSFDLGLPLVPDLPLTDLSALVEDYTFQDGVQVMTPSNSTLCDFRVATNSAGLIVDWDITMRETPKPAAGDPQGTIDTSPAGDQADSVPAGGTDCAGSLVPTASAMNMTAGTWSPPSVAISPFIYAYTGLPFASADPPWTTSNRIIGSITLTGPLPPLAPDATLVPFLLDYSFSDGVQTRSSASSTLCLSSAAADTVGNIASWNLAFREAPTPAAGDPQLTLSTNDSGDQSDQFTAQADPCASGAPDFDAKNDTPGTWTSAIPAAPPVSYTYQGAPYTEADPPWMLGQRLRHDVIVIRWRR